MADEGKKAKGAGNPIHSFEGPVIHMSQFWMFMYINDQILASVFSYFTNGGHPNQFLQDSHNCIGVTYINLDNPHVKTPNFQILIYLVFLTM